MLWDIIKLLLKHKRQLAQLKQELKGIKSIMSDLQTRQDTLDDTIHKVSDLETQQATKLAADDQAVTDGKAALADMTAQRDALQASNVTLTTQQQAEVTKLDTSIAALQKLIPAAQAPAAPADGSSTTTPDTAPSA